MSKNTRHATEQIVNKLRQADVEPGKDKSGSVVCKTFRITDQTYYRWQWETASSRNRRRLPR